MREEAAGLRLGMERFPQGLKPASSSTSYGGAEAPPLQSVALRSDALEGALAEAVSEDREYEQAYQYVERASLASEADHAEDYASYGCGDQEDKTEQDDAAWLELQEAVEDPSDGAERWAGRVELVIVGDGDEGVA